MRYALYMQPKKRKKLKITKSNSGSSPYSTNVQSLIDSDPLLQLCGSGKDLWADEHADDYVRRLREDWDDRTAWEIVEEEARVRRIAKGTDPSEPKVHQDDKANS
jgi:hypothetical protein